jgi:hypothetical protein
MSQFQVRASQTQNCSYKSTRFNDREDYPFEPALSKPSQPRIIIGLIVFVIVRFSPVATSIPGDCPILTMRGSASLQLRRSMKESSATRLAAYFFQASFDNPMLPARDRRVRSGGSAQLISVDSDLFLQLRQRAAWTLRCLRIWRQ